MLTITIPGKPIAQRRPRFAHRGKHVVTYSDQETEAGKWIQLAKDQLPDQPLQGPVRVAMVFYMPIPKYLVSTKAKRALMDAGLVRHTVKPDTSNLIKFAEDVLNELLWQDDAQIYEVYARKVYAKQPATVIHVIEE